LHPADGAAAGAWWELLLLRLHDGENNLPAAQQDRSIDS
jgi:hypothetical protein